MIKAIKGIRHKNGKPIKSTELEPYPEEPSRKDLTNFLLNRLLDAKEHYKNKLLTFDKNSVPEDLSNIFFGLIDEIEDFLTHFEMLVDHTKSGKSKGRNKTIEAMKIAADVLVEYQHINKDMSAIPTGRHFFEEVNARINNMALRGEACPMNISLRTAQQWAKKMRDGSFP